MTKLTWYLHQNPVYNSASPFMRNLSALMPSSAQFSTLADGGFSDGTLTLDNVSRALLEEIWETWLVKRVIAVDGAGNVAYEGFISEIEATRGYHTYNQTVDALANRVFVEYTYAGGSCPSGGTCYGRVQRNETDVLSTAQTQTTIGIKEEWLDATGVGVITTTVANAIGDRRLRERMYQRSNSFTLGGGADSAGTSVTLTLCGYYGTLQWRKQTVKYQVATAIETIVSGALTTGSKAQFIDTANYTYDTTSRTVQYNTSATPQWISDYIQDVIAAGDSSGKRLFFQVWENRKPYLVKRSSSPKYYTRSNDFRIYDANRGVVAPYMVRAGGYISTDDLRADLDEQSDVALRRRASLIEETHYDAINDVLTIPPPSEQVSIERLLARARKQVRRKL